jgi:hypothetical protein
MAFNNRTIISLSSMEVQGDDLLHAIFGFSQDAASDLHITADAASLAAILSKFIDCLQQQQQQQQRSGNTSNGRSVEGLVDAAAADTSNSASLELHILRTIWPGLQQAELNALASAVSIIRSSRVHLLPEYGCALLALGPTAGSEDGALPAAPSLRLGQLSLHLVGLDNWEFRLHRWAAENLHCQASIVPQWHSTTVTVVPFSAICCMHCLVFSIPQQ